MKSTRYLLYFISTIFAVFSITYFANNNFSLGITLAIMCIFLIRFTIKKVPHTNQKED